MQHQLTLEISYDDDRRQWTVGVLSRWNGVIEICRSTELGPFATVNDVWKWIEAIYQAWSAPTLGEEASESLHDAFLEHVV